VTTGRGGADLHAVALDHRERPAISAWAVRCVRTGAEVGRVRRDAVGRFLASGPAHPTSEHPSLWAALAGLSGAGSA